MKKEKKENTYSISLTLFAILFLYTVLKLEAPIKHIQKFNSKNCQESIIQSLQKKTQKQNRSNQGGRLHTSYSLYSTHSYLFQICDVWIIFLFSRDTPSLSLAMSRKFPSLQIMRWISIYFSNIAFSRDLGIWLQSTITTCSSQILDCKLVPGSIAFNEPLLQWRQGSKTGVWREKGSAQC